MIFNDYVIISQNSLRNENEKEAKNEISIQQINWWMLICRELMVRKHS